MTALAAIHVAKKQLGMDEDSYRAVLKRVTGKESSKAMSEGERGKVLEEFRRLGFSKTEGAARAERRKLDGKYAPKLQALWIGAWNLGIVRNRDDKALVAFVKRQTGIDHTRFLTHGDDAAKAIEALKKWMAREAKVDWSARPDHEPAFTDAPGYRIAIAQWVLARRAWPDLNGSFQEFAERLAGARIHAIEPRGWQAVMNELGRLIRKAQASDKLEDQR